MGGKPKHNNRYEGTTGRDDGTKVLFRNIEGGSFRSGLKLWDLLENEIVVVGFSQE